jgi:hypothetical protein
MRSKYLAHAPNNIALGRRAITVDTAIRPGFAIAPDTISAADADADLTLLAIEVSR